MPVLTESNHDATRPNLSQDERDALAKFLLEQLHGRDFVLVVLEHPTAIVASNARTPHGAKAILQECLNKPIS